MLQSCRAWATRAHDDGGGVKLSQYTTPAHACMHSWHSRTYTRARARTRTHETEAGPRLNISVLPALSLRHAHANKHTRTHTHTNTQSQTHECTQCKAHARARKTSTSCGVFPNERRRLGHRRGHTYQDLMLRHNPTVSLQHLPQHSKQVARDRVSNGMGVLHAGV